MAKKVSDGCAPLHMEIGVNSPFAQGNIAKIKVYIRLASLVALLMTGQICTAQDEVDIWLHFTNGPLTGDTALIRLYVTSLPSIGSSKIYDPEEHGTINDLHASIGGLTFDDSDDVDFPIHPRFILERTAVVTGDGGGGRSADIVLYGPDGERFELLMWGDMVGINPIHESEICIFQPDGYAKRDNASTCFVSSIVMNNLVNEEKGIPTPPPEDDDAKRLKNPGGGRSDPPRRRNESGVRAR